MYKVISQYHRTPLMTAAGVEGNLAVVQAFVEAGASTDITNANGQTAYDVAIAAGNQEIIDYLTSV